MYVRLRERDLGKGKIERRKQQANDATRLAGVLLVVYRSDSRSSRSQLVSESSVSVGCVLVPVSADGRRDDISGEWRVWWRGSAVLFPQEAMIDEQQRVVPLRLRTSVLSRPSGLAEAMVKQRRTREEDFRTLFFCNSENFSQQSVRCESRLLVGGLVWECRKLVPAFTRSEWQIRSPGLSERTGKGR